VRKRYLSHCSRLGADVDTQLSDRLNAIKLNDAIVSSKNSKTAETFFTKTESTNSDPFFWYFGK
jgi:hypothetical protein